MVIKGAMIKEAMAKEAMEMEMDREMSNVKNANNALRQSMFAAFTVLVSMA